MSSSILDLEEILNSTLEGTVPAPSYETPPTGIYILSVVSAKLAKVEAKGDKPESLRITTTFSVDATEETDGTPVPDGSLFASRNNWNDQGKPYFLSFANNLLQSDTSTAPLGTVLGALEDLESIRCRVVTDAAGFSSVKLALIED